MRYRIGDIIRSSWLNSINETGVVVDEKMCNGILVYYISYINSFDLTIYTYEVSASILMSRANICEI